LFRHKNGRTVKGVNFRLRDAGDPVELAKIYSMKELMNWFSRHLATEERRKLIDLVLEAATINIPFTVGAEFSVKDVDVLLQNGADSIHQFIGS
jgi:imidazole glycerol phosphate synthase subunit HisF